MPIVPEKMSARQGSRSSLSSQFWESTEHSTRYIDGRVWKLACEPPALYINGSSGVSRSQQLVALQALGIPAIPSYDQHSGGVVRVCFRTRLDGCILVYHWVMMEFG